MPEKSVSCPDTVAAGAPRSTAITATASTRVMAFSPREPERFLVVPVSDHRLLETERFDRVELRGLPCRVEAENNPDHGGEPDRDRDRIR